MTNPTTVTTTDETATSAYDAITLRHYSDHTLAERGRSVVAEFSRVRLVMNPGSPRTDMVDLFLKAFIARKAEACGLDFKMFNLDERQVSFTDWRTGSPRAVRWGAADKFQRARALQDLCDAVPAPVWGKKKG